MSQCPTALLQFQLAALIMSAQLQPHHKLGADKPNACAVLRLVAQSLQCNIDVLINISLACNALYRLMEEDHHWKRSLLCLGYGRSILQMDERLSWRRLARRIVAHKTACPACRLVFTQQIQRGAHDTLRPHPIFS